MKMKTWTIFGIFSIALILILAVGGWWFLSAGADRPTDADTQPTKVVINEAVRTLLYLPLYHAQHQGYFRDEGVEVQIVTGGTATASFAAMLAGEAHFSQADPMYVPISREQGSETRVVAQVVARIAVWGLSMDEDRVWTPEQVRGARISTHQRPMTAYVYALDAVRELGLSPETDVEIIQSRPGGEIVPLLNRRSEFAFTLEPHTSMAVSQGARVVFSFPERLGDQIFTGLMTRASFIRDNRQTVVRVVRGYQRALDDLHHNPELAMATARVFFPQVDEETLLSAINRITREGVIPQSVLVPPDSWRRAIDVRVAAGDLSRSISVDLGCDLSIMREAIQND